MKNPDFLICAPLHVAKRSNGVLGLIQLAKTMEKLGRTAYMCQILGSNDEDVCKHDLNTYIPDNDQIKEQIAPVLQVAEEFGVKLFGEFTREKIDASYVVYPEAVLGNPLGAKNVVRYFLNRDGMLKNGARVTIGITDFILTHSKVMQPLAQHVCYFSRMNPLFNRYETVLPEHRKIDITYIGKGSLYGCSGKIANTVSITRTWPATKEELAILLRNCRFFYTADACSNINNEALACGAIPVFIHNGPWTDAEIDAFEPGGLPRVRLGTKPNDDFFIRFESDRGRYLQGLQALEQCWESSVAEMIGKVDRHFESRETASQLTPSHLPDRVEAMRPERSSGNTRSTLSRKERKRWRAAPMGGAQGTA